MARVRLNETNDLPEDYRWLFERMEKRGGVMNIFRAFSHTPEALRRFMKLGTYFLEEGKTRSGAARAGDPARRLRVPRPVRVLAAHLDRSPRRPHRRADPRGGALHTRACSTRTRSPCSTTRAS